MSKQIHKNILVVVCICCLCILASCATVPTVEHENGEFFFTRHAIGQIKNKNLRRDFHNMVDGVEYGLDTGDEELALEILENLVTMSFFLNRTITPKIAIDIIESMRDDCRQKGMSLLIWADMYKIHEDHKCYPKLVQKCQRRQGWTCFDFGSKGCGDNAGGIFIWQTER